MSRVGFSVFVVISVGNPAAAAAKRVHSTLAPIKNWKRYHILLCQDTFIPGNVSLSSLSEFGLASRFGER